MFANIPEITGCQKTILLCASAAGRERAASPVKVL
jgi:hypothetical protein